MATLADVNATLKKQNKSQDETTKSVGGLSSRLQAFLRGQQNDKLKDLETEREAKASGRVSTVGSRVRTAGAAGISGLEGVVGSASGAVGGLLSRIAGLVPAAFALVSSGALIRGLASGILKRGIPLALINYFADAAGDFVENALGSKELGDAVQRGLKVGSVLGLLGRRFFLIGSAIGAVMTKENQKEISELSDNLLKTAKDLNLLPEDATFASVLKSIQEGANKALKALNSLLKGDFTSSNFTENWDELAIAAAGIFTLLNPFGTIGKMVTAVVLAYKTLKGLGMLGVGMVTTAAGTTFSALRAGAGATVGAVKAIPGQTGPSINAADLAKEDLELENKRRLDNLSRGQRKRLEKAGYRVQNGVLQKLSPSGSGAALGAAKADDVLSNVAKSENILLKASKIGNFGRFLKMLKAVPFLGSLVSAAQLASIVGDDKMSMDEKISSAGGVFGALLAGTGGAALGGLIGTALGGPLIGTALGAAVGAFGGDYAGRALAQWLMGKPIDVLSDGLNEQLNNALGLTSAGAGVNYSDQAMSQAMLQAQSYAGKQGAAMHDAIADYFLQNSGAYGGGQAPAMIDASTTSNTNVASPQAAIVPNGSAKDHNDPTQSR